MRHARSACIVTALQLAPFEARRTGPSVAGDFLADARRSSGAGQVSPNGVMGLGRGPGRFCLGGEVLLEQVGADPEAGGTWNVRPAGGCCGR
jgi:hypothetical protein